MQVKKGNLIYLFLILMVFSSCSPEVKLEPDIVFESSVNGNKKRIVLKVVDERIYREFDEVGSIGLSIKTKVVNYQNISGIYYDLISEGLHRNDFVLLSSNCNGDVILEVKIRSIYYYNYKDTERRGRTQSAIKIVAKNGLEIYENFYRVENEERAPFRVSEHSERMLNQAVSDTIEKIFRDKKLFEFLSR